MGDKGGSLHCWSSAARRGVTSSHPGRRELLHGGATLYEISMSATPPPDFPHTAHPPPPGPPDAYQKVKNTKALTHRNLLRAPRPLSSLDSAW
jgi:hypothetical protein